MLTKEDFIKLSNSIPFQKVTIDGIGEIGLILFRSGEFEKFIELTPNQQIQFCVIDEKGERVFSETDVEGYIAKDMSNPHKKRILDMIIDVNTLNKTQDDIKKN